jgi:type IV secretion system protein TrbL
MPTDPSILTALLTRFLGQFQLGFGRLLPAATWLLQTLALIEIILVALWWALQRQDVLASLLQRVLRVGFFVYLVTTFPTIIGAIVDSFVFAGLAAGGNTLRYREFVDPSQVAAFGLTATMPIFEHLQHYSILGQLANPVDSVVTGLAGLIILLAFFLIAIQIFLTYLKFYLAAVVGFFLVPFGVNRHTAFIAERVFAMVLAFGVKLMVLAFIASAAMPVLFALNVPPDPSLNQIFTLLLASLAIAFLAWHAPAVAAGLMAGSPSLTAGTAAGSALAGGLALAGATRATGQAVQRGMSYGGAIGRAGVTSTVALGTAATHGWKQPVALLGPGAGQAVRHNRIAAGFRDAVQKGHVAGTSLASRPLLSGPANGSRNGHLGTSSESAKST